MKTGGGFMPFNILVGAGFFVDKQVDRTIVNLIQEKDIILIGNANTLSTSAFRLQDGMIKLLLEKGAKKVIYTELTSRNMSILKKTDIIYIMGGDVRELLNLYQNELFKTLIKKHLKRGLLIAEKEAGILLSERIDWYLKECLKIKDATYQGLEVIHEKIFLAKSRDDQDEKAKIEKIEKNYQIEIKKLITDECFFTSSI